MAKTYATLLYGVDIHTVEIESFVGNGFSGLTLLGLPGDITRDMKERLRSVLEYSGIGLPAKRIVVNISAPLPVKQSSTPLEQLDFAIASCIVWSLDEHKNPHFEYPHPSFFGGNLTLGGEVRPVKNILLYDNINTIKESSFIHLSSEHQEKMPSYPSLLFFTHFKNWLEMRFSYPLQKNTPFTAPPLLEKRLEHEAQIYETLLHFQDSPEILLALILASAGRHHLLLAGEPGVGKSFAVHHMAKLLPPLLEEESYQLKLIYQEHSFKPVTHIERPFRSPHHTSTTAALLGGANLKPGEATLAHRGILFLDELAEFSRGALEGLREPLDSQMIFLSRSGGQVQFPADFQLCATTNPCPCGYLLSQTRACRCQPTTVRKYLQKMSGPILDRFAIKLWIPSEHERQYGVEPSLFKEMRKIDLKEISSRISLYQKDFYRNPVKIICEKPIPHLSRRSQHLMNQIYTTFLNIFPELDHYNKEDLLLLRNLEAQLQQNIF